MNTRICAVGVLATSLLTSVGAQSFTDVWDISRGTEVTAHSSLDLPDYDARDAFGGNFGSYWPEAGSIVFADESAPFTVDYLEWKTVTPVTITGYNLFVNGDGGDTGYRELGTFILKAKSLGSSTFDLVLDAFTPTHPYNFAEFSRTIGSVTAQEFRAEFVNSGDIDSSYRGIRVVELDAVPEPEHMAIAVGASLLGLALLRCRIFRQATQ
ncbi:MAG: hypothetical protein KIT22_03445 [Verrucomicrobiae bacterium]|nr:hypothetical protein [Verrucomicrobiae bacterium]